VAVYSVKKEMVTHIQKIISQQLLFYLLGVMVHITYKCDTVAIKLKGNLMDNSARRAGELSL
jgi:hypothetical protein